MKKEKNMINRQKGSHILEILKEGGDNHIFEICTKIINNQNVPDYPFDYEKDTLVWPFSERMLQEKEKLHINDIVVHNHPQNCFLLNFEPNVDLYDIGGTIVRAKIITPEYLFLYLKSEIASRIWKELCVSAGVCRIELFRHGAWDGKSTKTIPSEFSGFPVVLPEKPDEYYCDYFQKFSKPNDHHYTKHVDIPFGTIGDVLDREIVETIRLHNAELVGKQVREDIEELNICFSNGAYKAALILSGSILEAVLLDWLSEIDGINYFEKRVKVRKARRDKKGDLILDEEGNPAFEDVETDKLQDYIDKIKEIKKPEWMEEAEHAHEIRKKRNLVHAKLCLKKDAKIDKETCRRLRCPRCH